MADKLSLLRLWSNSLSNLSKVLVYGLPLAIVVEVLVAGSNFDSLVLGRAVLGRTLPSDVDGLGRPAITCLAAAADFSPSPEAAPTLLVLRSPRLEGGTVTWVVWIGCAEEGDRELSDETDVTLVITFPTAQGVDLASPEVEELLWTAIEPRLAVRPGPDARVLRPGTVVDRAGFLGKVGSGGTTDSRLFTLLVVGPNVDMRLVDGATDSRGRRVVEGREVATV
jgi:hypothetical protein